MCVSHPLLPLGMLLPFYFVMCSPYPLLLAYPILCKNTIFYLNLEWSRLVIVWYSDGGLNTKSFQYQTSNSLLTKWFR